MKKENKKTNNKNIIKTFKIITIILAIALISMIGFFGVYSQNKNQMSNKVKDYTYAMDIDGARNIKLELNTDTTEVVKDSEGNIIEDATDEEIETNGYITEEVPNNSDEVKTEENYNKSKKIIERRLKELGVQDYNISLNRETGEMLIEIPENSNTDSVVGRLNTVGKFEIIDTETKEVLLSNDDIKSSNVLYNTSTTGTTVYLEIAFNKEGKNKLKEITQTYVTVTDDDDEISENEVEAEIVDETAEETEETETATEKTITMKIDDEEIMTTSFDEPITTGKIQLSVGTATTDTSTLEDYIRQAQNIATTLNNGNLPLKYDIAKNQYILSNISENDLTCIAIFIAIVALIGIIVLIVKYKTNGLLASLAYIGLAAIYLILIRYANVVISIESIFGIVIMLALNYIFTVILLKNINENIKAQKENAVKKATSETYKKFFIRIIPICIIAVVFSFIKWIPLSSFGTTSVWGLALIAAYNAIITKSLLKIKVEDK